MTAAQVAAFNPWVLGNRGDPWSIRNKQSHVVLYDYIEYIKIHPYGAGLMTKFHPGLSKSRIGLAFILRVDFRVDLGLIEGFIWRYVRLAEFGVILVLWIVCSFT